MRHAPRRRLVGSITFEHQYLNAGVDYLDGTDQTSGTRAGLDSKGYSVWATPRSPRGWEGLLRYDHLTPNGGFGDQTRTRTILGLAYWFPHQGNVSTALLFDWDAQKFTNITTAPVRVFGIHGLVNF